jgi:hypothetical protein
MKTLAFGELSRCVVLVHGLVAPTDDEWDAYVLFLKSAVERAGRVRVVVSTEGGAPTPRQRKAMDRVMTPFYRTARVAIVTGSTFVRGVVTAFRLIYPWYRAFDPTDLGGALTYVDVPAPEQDAAAAMVAELAATLRTAAAS